jgi:hypothetical protein
LQFFYHSNGITAKHTWINAKMRGFHDIFVVMRRLSVGFFMVRRGRGDLGL